LYSLPAAGPVSVVGFPLATVWSFPIRPSMLENPAAQA
jgi:hypothetical protein